MASRLINSVVSLLLLLTLLTASCFDRVTCVKHEINRLARCYNQSPENSMNMIHNKTTGIKGLVDKKFIFPGLYAPKVSTESNLRTFSHHTGYYGIENSYDARMFYYFFESRKSKTDPLVLWLAGGPGVGSLDQVFYGNGPFRINDDLSVKWNNFGWDKASNMLYIDQPIGAGYSYSSDYRDYHYSTTDIVNDLYDFLRAFYKAHPEFIKNDFYIAGCSYAGHTIPVLASRVQKQNKAKNGIHINLKGFAIGNGFINPEYKSSFYHDFALANKLITRNYYEYLKKLNNHCVRSIQYCQTDNNFCAAALHNCDAILLHTLDIIGDIDPYDIRKKLGQTCEDFSKMINYLNLSAVKKALNVGNMEYVIYNQTMFSLMASDFMKNYAEVIPQMLEDGIKILIYDGEYDLLCNWIGNLKWMNGMKWSGQRQFSMTKLSSYIVDGKRVGQVKRTGPLTYLKVHDASHAVTMDQPKVALRIFRKWIHE